MDSIDDFLRTFMALERQLAAEEPSTPAMDQLLESLTRIDKRLYFHIGSHDRGTDLILSAEGHADLMPVVSQIEQRFPRAQGWRAVPVYEGLLLFGERNETVFPATENGDALFQMAQAGDPLWIARDVDFSCVFPDKAQALGFAAELRAQQITAEIEDYDGAPGFRFSVEASQYLIPSHSVIGQAEELLGRVAARYQGRLDGWGCLSPSVEA